MEPAMTSRPNILILMVDQLNGTLFPDGPADWLHAPNLKALAAKSVRFSDAYSPSPLCAPARASFMTGALPSRTKVYDNAAEFAADLPCFTHHLRRAGYQTSLSGKMHFVGPDQLHGFEQRLTTDIYPADFGWTPDYRKPGERIDWWYHNMGSVTGAGVAETTNQLEYDDDVTHFAKQKLYELSRGLDDRPWCLTVSFSHPHDPFVARRKYWDLYEGCNQISLQTDPIPYAKMDPHSQRLLDSCDHEKFDITPENIARARQGYFANISYVDDKIGEILQTLNDTQQEAVIVFVSDHGDLLGERGLWFKMSFYEGSARVPLMICAPEDLTPHLVSTPVSALDVAPTVCDLASIPMHDVTPWCDGESLVPLAKGAERSSPVAMEYAAEGSITPLVCLRYGKWKYTRCLADPDQLFDLEVDPQERTNLATHPAHAGTVQTLRAKSEARWDLAAFDAQVRESQARRWLVYEALRQGQYHAWDHSPNRDGANSYMRNHMDLNVLEEEKRFPRGA
jgi:choline-sulfatase